jgi:hypothetical protein
VGGPRLSRGWAAAQDKFDTLQMAIETVAAEHATSGELDRPRYLQQQLWMLEQAHQAEKRYRASLDSVAAELKDKHRLLATDTAMAQRGLDKVNFDMRRAQQKCIQLQDCKHSTLGDLKRLGRTVERSQQARAKRFMELYETHQSSREVERQVRAPPLGSCVRAACAYLQKVVHVAEWGGTEVGDGGGSVPQRIERHEHLLDVTAACAGDPEAMRKQAEAVELYHRDVRAHALVAMTAETQMRKSISRLRAITNAQDADGMLASYFAQKLQVTTGRPHPAPVLPAVAVLRVSHRDPTAGALARPRSLPSARRRRKRRSSP